MAATASMSIRAKFTWLTAATVLALFLLFAGVLWTEHSMLLKDREEKLRNLVEVAHATVGHFDTLAADGKMSKEEAQKAALGALRTMRYDKTEYFWVNDFTPTMVMHPIKPELDGKNLSELKDPAGKFLFLEFARVVKADGAGFVDYLWPKPGSSAPVPKLSYVKGYAPWGWIIGSGIYIDDLNTIFWNEATKFLVWGLAIAGLISGALIFVSRGLFATLGGEPSHASEITRRIAGGDLGSDIELAPGDSTSLLAAMRDMQASLRNMIVDVVSCANELETSSTQLLHSSETVLAASQEQSSAASAMAAAVEEMSVSMDTVTENARDAHAVSLEADRVSGEGADVIQRAAAEMKNIADAVQASSGIIKELGHQSDEIGSIVKTIKEIADQTNLLALNAAIEAARAGEQGRGFAVVADEVRKLAERTTASTLEIASTINNIGSGTRNAVSSMETGVAQVGNGVRLASEAGEQIVRIREGAQRAMTMVTDITSSIQEQSSAAQDIARNVERIAQMAEQSATSVQTTAVAASRLSALSQRLQDAVSRFKA
jgi:methyl-accepting chemotaxis protein